MNLKLLQEHVDSALASIVPMELKEDGSNAVDFFCADVVAGKSFAQNYGGYPRSEIAEINDQENVALQMAMLKSLQAFPEDNANAGKTDAEIALSHRSRYQQTATEMQSWINGQLQIRDARRAAAYQAAAAQAAAKKAASQPKVKSKTQIVEPE